MRKGIMRTMEGRAQSVPGGAVTVLTVILLYLTACAAPVQRAAAHKCPVDGTAILERNGALSDEGWTLVFSTDPNARLEAVEVTGNDGLKHPNLVALDCLVDTIVKGLRLCPGAWRHDEDIAAVLVDGRLLVRGYCTSDQR